MATRAEVSAARVDAYAQQTAALRDAARNAVVGYYLAGQFRDADMSRFLGRAVPVVLSARRRMASLTAAYLTQRLRDVGTAPARPVSVPDTSLLRGVDALEVYQRPFKQVWTDLSMGSVFPDAVKAGEVRVTQLVETDLQLAKTHAAQAVMEKSTGLGLFRRVLKGEHDCVKCILTSTKVYTRRDLLPIHPGCDCDVEEIGDIGKFKADSLTLLADAHDLVEKTFGPEVVNASGRGYSDLIAVRDHGEYGPTLTERGHHFTGPSAI